MCSNSNLDNRLEHKNNGTFHDGTQGKPGTNSHNNNKSCGMPLGGLASLVRTGVSAAGGMVFANKDNSSQNGKISGL